MKRILKNAIVTFVMLLLGLSTAFLAYLHFFASGGSDLSGEWTTRLDMTAQAAVTASGWLQEIEGVSVSPEVVAPYMNDVTVEVDLTMEQTGRLSGTFRCHVLPESYEACRQTAYEAFAGCFRELLGERLHMAGYEGGIDQEAVEALVVENFGMSTVSYLMTCGPALLPSMEELQAVYEGSGTYEIAEGILIRRFEEGGTVLTREERCIREDGTLILLGEEDAENGGLFFARYPVIYTRNSDQH